MKSFRDSGGRRAEDDRRNRGTHLPSYKEQYTRPVGGFQGENSFRSRAKPPQTSTTCTLCRETLRTHYDLQAHLSSPTHLDMVVRYPMIPLQDILISEPNVESRNEIYSSEQNQDGGDILAVLGSPMTQVLNQILMVRNVICPCLFICPCSLQQLFLVANPLTADPLWSTVS